MFETDRVASGLDTDCRPICSRCAQVIRTLARKTLRATLIEQRAAAQCDATPNLLRRSICRHNVMARGSAAHELRMLHWAALDFNLDFAGDDGRVTSARRQLSIALPVDEALPRLKAALVERTAVVLVAPPGAGKTTRVPLALLDAPWLGGRKIVMLEPRRLAARAAARRMAETLGEPSARPSAIACGSTAGSAAHAHRGRHRGRPPRMLQDDPALDGVGCRDLRRVSRAQPRRRSGLGAGARVAAGACARICACS